MLARQYRLTKKKEYDTVREKGKVVHGNSFSLGYLDRGDSEIPRFGMVVSMKISKNATKRNYIRRALWEALRQNLFQVKAGFDCVVIALPASADKYMDEIMHEVPKVLKSAKITK